MLATKRVATVALLGLSFSLLSNDSAHAISFTFTKIADTSTFIPDGTGTFTEFHAPSISGSNVAFLGKGSGFQRGIYTGLGDGLDKVVDTNTPIPGSPNGSFTNFIDSSISGSNVAFLGFGDGSSQTGIYLSTEQGLAVVADRNTPIPGGNGNFTGFNVPDLSGNNVVFLGTNGQGSPGIYLDNGDQLTVVADPNTPIPGGTGNFISFLSRAVSEDGVAFQGIGRDQSGIYTNIGGSLAVVADRNTLDPASNNNFTDFFMPPALSGDNVAFGGLSVGWDQAGIYTKVGSQLNAVATNSPDRGVLEFINFMSAPSISGSNTAFLAGFDSAIYTDVGGSFARLIGRDDTLDGKTLTSVDFSPISNGLSDGSLAFLARFSDGSQGIFRADLVSQPPQPEPVPEPTPLLGLLLVGILGGASQRLSRPQLDSRNTPS
ncbi:hypothetical protein H6F88_22095 [Oculatella sp. FACHB-28]|uniref:DUF7453 family protein n=1 Tax=Oculatella sp. FACHB-28 TaxID=2692845 RepID=UPI00168206F2|nr:hypothetical protein [Oculatella sp. FACHB-28]MBD1869863.1 hypothetical protein [Cyanobacteria bacterium FACHB-471]MBD2058657.1 hypothetical protein [Oculatella sp. FACHB-28]